MTSPSALPPHQDPTPNADHDRVTIMEYVTTLISTLDRRFDTLHQDLKDSITDRLDGTRALIDANDLRYQQRFDAQTKALDAALAAAKEAVQTALAAAEKATVKAEVAADKRFDAVNEFRQTLSDQAREFVRADYMLQAFEGRDQLIQALSDRIRELELARSATAGQQAGVQGKVTDQRAQLAAYLGVAGVLITIVIIVVNVLTSGHG